MRKIILCTVLLLFLNVLTVAQVTENKYQELTLNNYIKQYAVELHVNDEGKQYFTYCSDCAAEITVKDSLQRTLVDNEPCIELEQGLFGYRATSAEFTVGKEYYVRFNITSAEHGSGIVDSIAKINGENAVSLNQESSFDKPVTQGMAEIDVWSFISSVLTNPLSWTEETLNIQVNLYEELFGVDSIEYKAVKNAYDWWVSFTDDVSDEIGRVVGGVLDDILPNWAKGVYYFIVDVGSYFGSMVNWVILFVTDTEGALRILDKYMWHILGAFVGVFFAPLMVVEAFILGEALYTVDARNNLFGLISKVMHRNYQVLSFAFSIIWVWMQLIYYLLSAFISAVAALLKLKPI